MNMDIVKFAVHRHLRIEHGVHLTPKQLDDVDRFYHAFRKEAVKDLVLFRFINMSLGVIFLSLTLAFSDEKIVIGIIVAFVLYNLIHGIVEWRRYKQIPQPEMEFDDN